MAKKKTTREAYNSFEKRCHERIDELFLIELTEDERERLKYYFTEVFAALYSDTQK